MGGTTEVSLDGRRGGVVAGVALPGAHHCEPEWLLPADGQRGGGAELDTRGGVLVLDAECKIILLV